MSSSALGSRVLNRVVVWTAILAALGVLALFVYQRLTFEQPIGSGPAGPAVTVERFAKPWNTRRTVLLAIGDSVTAGFGSTRGHSYVEMLTKQPVGDDPALASCTLTTVFPQLTVVRKAIAGSTSFDLPSQIPRKPYDVDTQGVVVMTSGGNDLIHDYGRTPPSERAMYGATWEQAQPWLPGYSTRLEDTAIRLGQLFPGGYQLFIGTVYDPTDGVGDIERAGLPAWPDGLKLLADYNQRLITFAAKHPHVHVVDMHALFLGHGIHCTDSRNPAYRTDDPHYWYFRNLEDPNDRGYDALRRLFLNELSAVLAPRP